MTSETPVANPTSALSEAQLKQALFQARDLKTVQGDQKSVYSSAKSFEELDIPAALLKDLFLAHFDEPSFIQGESLPRILTPPYHSLLAQSQNGTGKTLAFVLGMLSRVDPNDTNLQAICLFESRELAIQTYKDYIEKLTKNYKVNTALLLRDSPVRSDITKAQVILATPLMLDHHMKEVAIEAVRIVVIDEADQVLDNKTFQNFFEMLFSNLTKNKTQFLLFTATLTQNLHDFVGKYIKESQLNIIKVEEDKQFVPTNLHYFIRVSSDDQKVDVLKGIFKFIRSSHSFIFVNKKKYAKTLQEQLEQQGFKAQYISSEHHRSTRDQIIKQFKDGLINVLIATNLLARGIDIPAAKAVLNFDMPIDKDNNPDVNTYMHRQGRTGRFARNGIVINFVESQSDYNLIMKLKNDYDVNIEEFTTNNLDIFNKAVDDTQEIQQ